MSEQTDSFVIVSDKLADIYSELRFLNVVVRGALDVAENEGIAACSVIQAAKEPDAETAYDALLASLFYINERLSSIISEA